MARAPKPPVPTGADRRPLSSLRLVWSFASRYRGHVLGALLALAGSSLGTLAIPYEFRRVVDRGFAGGSGAAMEGSFQALLLIVAFLAVATGFRFYFVSWLGERVVADLRTAVHRHLLTLAPRFFEENRPSEIASRLTSDTSVIEQVVGSTVSQALRNVVTGAGGLVYMFWLAPKLAALLVVGIPLVMLPLLLIGRRVRDLSRVEQDRIAEVSAVVVETLGAMKIVQAFGQERRERERFGRAVEDAFAGGRRRIAWRATMTAAVILLIFGSITLILREGAFDVAAHRMTGGAISAFVLVAVFVAGSFGSLTEVYGDLLRGAGASGRISELLATPAEIRAPAQRRLLPEPADGRIAFDDIVFRYPTRPDVAALDGFSLAVAPGETVALVGPSGAGKSTVFQLAERFYDPASGSVSLDGVPLPDLDPAALRSRIALVPQETVIFGASARDNLRYGRWEAGEDEIWAAAEAANAAGFLRALPQGLDTFLGEGGARLSGGQRQRIAIARALLRDAALLLLDEATSALDAESERAVQGALETLMAKRTTLVIAHRLATVRAADRIVVMDGGRIVEQGSHDRLLAAGGLYARLARLQFDGPVAATA